MKNAECRRHKRRKPLKLLGPKAFQGQCYFKTIAQEYCQHDHEDCHLTVTFKCRKELIIFLIENGYFIFALKNEIQMTNNLCLQNDRSLNCLLIFKIFCVLTVKTRYDLNIILNTVSVKKLSWTPIFCEPFFALIPQYSCLFEVFFVSNQGSVPSLRIPEAHDSMYSLVRLLETYSYSCTTSSSQPSWRIEAAP